MNQPEARKPGPKLPGSFTRKALSVPDEGLVRVEAPPAGRTLPVLLRPAVEGVSLVAWARDNRPLIDEHLLRSGAIFFRGFQVDALTDFEAFIAATSDRAAQYNEPATPRTQVSGQLYTSTDFPPVQRIFMHNENSNTNSWPLKIYFLCVTPSATGGETPVADSRRVFQAMDPELRRRFVEKRVMYVRNFGSGLGLPWQAVFRATEPAEVDAYCKANGIATEWGSGDRLRIRYVRHAAGRHPRTGEAVWFNHTALFHSSVLDPEIRNALHEEFSEEDLPFNAFFGDGSAIPPSALEEIYRVYREEMVALPWGSGDILMLDNMLAAHGREPYTGERRVVVGMADPFEASQMDAVA